MHLWPARSFTTRNSARLLNQRFPDTVARSRTAIGITCDGIGIYIHRGFEVLTLDKERLRAQKLIFCLSVSGSDPVQEKLQNTDMYGHTRELLFHAT